MRFVVDEGAPRLQDQVMQLSPRRLTSLCTLALLSAACAESGQTGSPFGDPPQYQSSDNFGDPGAGGGLSGGMEDDGSRPPYWGTTEDSVVVSGDHALAVRDGRLTVWSFDAEGAGRALGSMSLPGRLRQLEANESMAWVVVSGVPRVDTETIPTSAEPLEVTRLLAIDLEDPENPSVVAEQELAHENHFWNFQRRGNDFFVLEEQREVMEPTCGAGLLLERSIPVLGMRVVHYAWSDDAWSLEGSQDLPTEAPYAYYSNDAFFVADTVGAGQNEVDVHFVDFSAGSLSSGTIEDVPGVPMSIVRLDEQIVLLADASSPVLVSAHLADGVTLSQTAPGRPLSLAPISNSLVGLFSEERDEPPLLIDVSNPASPKVGAALPPRTSGVVLTEQGLVTAAATNDDRVEVTLWDVSDPSDPVTLSNVDFEGRSNSDSGSAFRFISRMPGQIFYDESLSLLVYPHNRTEEFSISEERSYRETLGTLSAVSLDEADLSFETSVELAQSASLPRRIDERLLNIGVDLETIDALSLLDADDPDATLTRLSQRKPIDSAKVDDLQFRLFEDEMTGRFSVERRDAEGNVDTLELDHSADELVVLGERIAALGMRNHALECAEFASMGIEPGEVPSTGPFDPCADFRGQGVSMLAVGGDFSIDESFSFSPLVETTGDLYERDEHLGYFRLPNDRLALVRQHLLRCESRAACDALEIPTSVSYSSGGCSSSDEECDTSSKKHETGALWSVRLAVLSSDDDPTLQDAVELPGRIEWGSQEWPLDMSRIVLKNGDFWGFEYKEHLYGKEGNSLSNSAGDPLYRFYLNRIEVLPDGNLEGLPPINVPGHPLLWQGDQLLTVEPVRTDDDAPVSRLHQSTLSGQGAFIDHSEDLDGAFVDARRVDDFVYLLLGPNACEAEPDSTLLPLHLEEGALAVGQTLALPGRYGFPFRDPHLEDGDLVLRGGTVNGAAAYIDLSEPGAPELESYRTLD